jgi:hypothetical protein
MLFMKRLLRKDLMPGKRKQTTTPFLAKQVQPQKKHKSLDLRTTHLQAGLAELVKEVSAA